jgi:hypothetical protein
MVRNLYIILKSGGYEEFYLLGYNTVQSIDNLEENRLHLQRLGLFLSSGTQHMKEKLVCWVPQWSYSKTLVCGSTEGAN